MILLNLNSAIAYNLTLEWGLMYGVMCTTLGLGGTLTELIAAASPRLGKMN